MQCMHMESLPFIIKHTWHQSRNAVYIQTPHILLCTSTQHPSATIPTTIRWCHTTMHAYNPSITLHIRTLHSACDNVVHGHVQDHIIKPIDNTDPVNMHMYECRLSIRKSSHAKETQKGYYYVWLRPSFCSCLCMNAWRQHHTSP